MRDDLADVGRAPAQRRDHDLEHVQPVVEIEPVRAFLGHLEQVAIGGRQDARSDADRRGRADPQDLAALDRAQ
ncbi:MAG: hypothetical protein U1E76_09475 [Planctomycetota bacterium]